MRLPTAKTLCTAAAVGAAATFIWLQLQPGLLLASTTPAGGDMGAHVWGPAFLRDHLLHHWRLSGWAPDWYNGFPAYHYYFPLPSILIVLLDVVLPYGVAFKLVTVLGLVMLPAAAAFLGRELELPFPTPPLMAIATIPFVFDRFHTIWGGNAASTLAGEFSFSISLALALVFLGLLARALRTGNGSDRALAAIALAATFLCHLIPGAFAVAAAGVLVLLRRPDRARWKLTGVVGATGMALTGFWLLPFLARLRYSNDMGWERTWDYLDNLLPFLRTDSGAPAAYTEHYKVVVPLAVLGALIGIIRRRRGAFALVGIGAAMAAAFRFVPAGPIWNARLLPFWYLSLYLLAALAIGELALLVADGLRPDDPLATPSPLPGIVATVAAFVAVFLVVGGPLGAVPTWLGQRSATSDHSFVPDWARWNYSGYERKPAYAEYQGVVATMAGLGRQIGCGRAMWEYEPQLDRYGTPMALMLLPYWTNGCIGSQEGLFFESSATVPYHFLNQSELSKTPSRAMRDLPYRDLDVKSGVEHLQLLGVRYYMAISPEAQAQAATNQDLRLVATTKPYPVTYSDGTKDRFWQVYEVRDAAIVTGLSNQPVVAAGVSTKTGWLKAAVDWYQHPARWDVPIADAGPAEWERISSASAIAPARSVRAARVTNIKTSDDRISFDVDVPGTPVLVKTSYFPNWKASGADGPYRVTPNLMVVVPTAKHVELHYGWTGVDLFGWLLALVGAAGVVALSRARRVRFPEPPKPPEVWVDPFVDRPRGHESDGRDELTTVGAIPTEPPAHAP